MILIYVGALTISDPLDKSQKYIVQKALSLNRQIDNPNI